MSSFREHRYAIYCYNATVEGPERSRDLDILNGKVKWTHLRYNDTREGALSWVMGSAIWGSISPRANAASNVSITVSSPVNHETEVITIVVAADSILHTELGTHYGPPTPSERSLGRTVWVYKIKLVSCAVTVNDEE